jgi:hypothetical protein
MNNSVTMSVQVRTANRPTPRGRTADAGRSGHDDGMSSEPEVRPGRDPIGDPIDTALAENPDQDYVGSRDLTRWPSACSSPSAGPARRKTLIKLDFDPFSGSRSGPI